MSGIFHRKLGEGFPLILIHGFCESHEIWNNVVEPLAEKFEVYTIDLPGFGKSELLQTSFSIDDVAEKVFSWIETEAIKNPVVLGHSLGGYVTLSMAKNHSEKIAAIGLFQSSAFPDSEEKKANRNKTIEFVNNYGVDPFVETFVPSLFFDKKHSAISQTLAIAKKTPKETLIAYTAAMRDRHSTIDVVKNYKKPFFILGGENDSIITPEIVSEHEKLAVHSKTFLLKNTGHAAMIENPEMAKNAIEKFMIEEVMNH